MNQGPYFSLSLTTKHVIHLSSQMKIIFSAVKATINSSGQRYHPHSQGSPLLSLMVIETCAFCGNFPVSFLSPLPTFLLNQNLPLSTTIDDLIISVLSSSHYLASITLVLPESPLLFLHLQCSTLIFVELIGTESLPHYLTCSFRTRMCFSMCPYSFIKCTSQTQPLFKVLIKCSRNLSF